MLACPLCALLPHYITSDGGEIPILALGALRFGRPIRFNRRNGNTPLRRRPFRSYFMGRPIKTSNTPFELSVIKRHFYSDGQE